MSISKSANKLAPKSPSDVMVIRDITPEITTFSTPFSRFGVMKIGGRSTLVRLRTGNLAIFSPTALTPEVKTKIQEKGTVKYIIAPDIEHHIWIGPWAKEYPNAEVIGPEALPEKREGDEATKGTKFHHVFTKSNKRDYKIGGDFDDEFDYEYVHAHQSKELVFCHKPSRTLIEADLVFNLPAREQYQRSPESPTSGVFTRVSNWMFSSSPQMMAQRRVLWYAIGALDRKGFGESARIIHGWDFDRVIPCHGDVWETGGKRIIDLATAWFREVK